MTDSTAIVAADLTLMFGLPCGAPINNGAIHTLDETAQHFGLSSDVVRTIEMRALRKLRHNPRIQEIAREHHFANV